MGWTDRVGAIEPGKWADIIAIDGDPLKDVKILQHVPFVMKSGVVYKDELTSNKEKQNRRTLKMTNPPQ